MLYYFGHDLCYQIVIVILGTLIAWKDFTFMGEVNTSSYVMNFNDRMFGKYVKSLINIHAGIDMYSVQRAKGFLKKIYVSFRRMTDYTNEVKDS